MAWSRLSQLWKPYSFVVLSNLPGRTVLIPPTAGVRFLQTAAEHGFCCALTSQIVWILGGDKGKPLPRLALFLRKAGNSIVCTKNVQVRTEVGLISSASCLYPHIVLVVLDKNRYSCITSGFLCQCTLSLKRNCCLQPLANCKAVLFWWGVVEQAETVHK